jgi:S-adenosylmethionine-diacylgycerolhomoserine-N-methlytransferase
MDRIYRHQRLIYDATRAWYLLGRDHLIRDIAPPPGAHVLEVACGTGRNLARIAARYPGCHLHGFDISSEMLRSAGRTLGGRAHLARADACGFDAAALFGRRHFDRIVLSYSLSMIPDWCGALERALDHLAEGGQLHIVDFGNQTGLPDWFGAGLRGWLARFHVEPRINLAVETRAMAQRRGLRAACGPLYRDYAQYAVVRRPLDG